MKKYSILISGFILLVAAMNGLCSLPASADIDWTRGQPTARIDDDGSVCNESMEKVVDWISGEIRSTDVCVVYGKDFDMAYTYGTKNGGSSGPLIKLHSTDTFSPLLGIGDAQVAPGTNTVVYNEKGILRPLALVRDFTKALIPEHVSHGVEYTDRIIDFKVSSSLFDYEFLTTAITKTGDGIASFKVSGNGRYVIAYFNNTGIVTYDLTTQQMTKLVMVPSLSGWKPYDQPRIEAVSNDGRFIFVAPGGQIVDTENCGDTSSTPLDFSAQILHICRMRDNADIIKVLVGNTAKIQGAQFSEDGNTLNFLTRDNDNDFHHIVIGATDVKIIKYLALGDSYSSGEGDVSYSDGETNYLPGTEDRNRCHISYRSYPFLLKEKWGLSYDAMRSIACSGARVTQDYYGDEEYTGQRQELEDKESDEKLHARNNALDNFAPGIIRQIDFVSKYKPDIVTFTGGGNDVGFGETIAYCASPHLKVEVSCPQVSDPQISANLRRAIDDEREPLTMFIQKIKEVSPATKVYLIGYPQFVSLDGCNDGSLLLNRAERLMIRSSVTRLNNILKLAAHGAGVYYVDIEDSLEGGQICQNSLYMTGPLKLSAQKIKDGYTQEAYHPNAKGHQKMSDAINDRIKNDNLGYTIINLPPENNGQRVIRMAVTKDYVGVGSEQTIAMNAGMFHPDGIVDIIGFSNKVTLARARVAHDGSLSVKIKIPPEMQPGYHLITLTGEDVSGGTVQVQQYITVHDDEETAVAQSMKPPLLSADANSNLTWRTILSVGNTKVLPMSGSDIEISQVVNYEERGRYSLLHQVLLIISGVITLIIAIIVKGALYVTKKER